MTKINETVDAGAQIVTMDRRSTDRRGPGNSAASADGGTQRRKKQRRRQIDPTTCERDYSNDEIEFMQAMDAYKRAAGRMFPTCSEILEVIHSLGYVRLSEQQLAMIQGTEPAPAEQDAPLDEQNEDEDVESEVLV